MKIYKRKIEQNDKYCHNFHNIYYYNSNNNRYQVVPTPTLNFIMNQVYEGTIENNFIEDKNTGENMLPKFLAKYVASKADPYFLPYLDQKLRTILKVKPNGQSIVFYLSGGTALRYRIGDNKKSYQAVYADALPLFLKGYELKGKDDRKRDLRIRLHSEIIKLGLTQNQLNKFIEFIKNFDFRANKKFMPRSFKNVSKKNLMDKINEFENTDCTLRDFNRLFNVNIKGNLSSNVEIGAPIGPALRRSLRIGDMVISHYFLPQYLGL